jgi:hypothetical protein
MCSLIIPGTTDSPLVKLDNESGRIEIQGKSTLCDPVVFYSSLLEQINNIHKNKLRTLNIRLSYINTGSTKWMLFLIKQLEKKAEPLNTMVVNWYYEEDDESMEMTGQDYQSMLKIPFNLIPEQVTDN